MDENEVLTPEEQDAMPDYPDFDPEYWEEKRREEWEAKLAPYRATRAQINEHDDLMAEALYEITLIELGVETEG